MAGDRERAGRHYGQSIEIIGAGDTTRLDVTIVRTFMAEAR
jgi:hypothetical protein